MGVSLEDLEDSAHRVVQRHPEQWKQLVEIELRQQCAQLVTAALQHAGIAVRSDEMSRVAALHATGIPVEDIEDICHATPGKPVRVDEALAVAMALGYSIEFSLSSLERRT